jgi:nucleoside-diphosphate-sugar epimerase
MSKARISILGCGWLGLPLAQQLIGNGYRVKGSTTRTDKLDALRKTGIEPYRIVLGDQAEGDLKGFLESDILVVDIPPGHGEDAVEHHVEQVSQLIDALVDSPVRHVLFVSSTSVYPALGREVTEQDASDPETADSPAGRALLYVEEMLRSESGFSTTVVRFSGLIGPGRNPINFLQRMKEIADPDQPMNLIHQDDCVCIIKEIIRRESWGEVFNASSPGHPTRKEFYRVAAESHGVEPLPSAGSGGRPFKIVNSAKLEKLLGYRFRHPDPLAVARE